MALSGVRFAHSHPTGLRCLSLHSPPHPIVSVSESSFDAERHDESAPYLSPMSSLGAGFSYLELSCSTERRVMDLTNPVTVADAKQETYIVFEAFKPHCQTVMHYFGLVQAS